MTWVHGHLPLFDDLGARSFRLIDDLGALSSRPSTNETQLPLYSPAPRKERNCGGRDL